MQTVHIQFAASLWMVETRKIIHQAISAAYLNLEINPLQYIRGWCGP